MPIDPNIPLQAKNPQIEVGANQLAMMNEAMKFNEMNRSIDTQNKLRDLYSQGIDVGTPEGFRKVAALDPATALKLRTDVLQGQKLQGDIKKTGLEITAKDMELARESWKSLDFNPSDNNFKAFLEDAVLNKKMTPAQAQQEWSQVANLDQTQRRAFIKNRSLAADKLFTQLETERSHRVNEGISAGNLAVNQQTLANAINPTLQATLASAKAGGTEVGKAKAQAAIALPGAIATGEEAIRKIDALVGSAPIKNAKGEVIVAGTKPAAGFGQAVGLGIPGLKYIPGSSVADFNARLNEIQGGAFLQAFNTLRGGGSITEKEGEKATAAINRMSTAQSEKEFNIAAREYQDVIRTGIANAKAKAAGGGPAPASGEIDFNSLK